MADKPRTDWEAIEREYRAGMLSAREIGRRHNVSEGAIRKKAKAEGWERPLADKVRAAVREKLVRNDGTQKPRASDEDIIDAASELGKEVQLTHRKDLQQLRAIGALLATRLAAFLNQEAPDGPFIGEKETVGDLFEKLARVKARLIPLERQAHNLDADAGASPAPDRKLEEIEAAIESKLARISASGGTE
ncbi:MAG: hypothetical protein ABII76_23220 [Pseudomonadota bacterium]